MGKKHSKAVHIEETRPSVCDANKAVSVKSSNSTNWFCGEICGIVSLTGWTVITDKTDAWRLVYTDFEKTPLSACGTLPSNIWGRCVGACSLRGLKTPEKPNQDNFSIVCDKHYTIFCLADGHGRMGHSVAHTVVDAMPAVLIQNQKLITDPHTALTEAFAFVQDGLCEESVESGATAVVLLMPHGQKRIIAAHVGDCRAALFTYAQGAFQGKNLTADHRPDDEHERQRIEAAGGEVRSSEKFYGPRIFVKDETYPGYAMSRSLGDKFGTHIGLSSAPDISEIKITNEDSMLVLGSDGMFEFLNSEQLSTHLQKQTLSDANTIAESLCNLSRRRWLRHNLQTTDDISAVVIHIQKFIKLFSGIEKCVARRG